MAGLQDWASWILADRNGQLGGNKSAALAELKKRASDVGQTFSQYIEPTLTIASGMAGSAVGGIVGMAGLPFGVDAASSAVQRTQDWMTYKPRTESGQKGLQWVGEKAEQISAPVNKAIGQTVASITNQLPGLDTYGQQIQQTIADKGPTQALGDYVTDTTGSPFLGTAAKLAPDIIDTVFGLKGLKAVTKGLPQYEIGDISGQAFGQKGIFGGIRAKNADLPAQAKAEQMLNSGATRDEVWAETGWFKDVDDSWKFEIDDTTFYHGTDSDIREIDPERFGSATDAFSAKQGFWQSDSPATAESYANFAARDAKIQKMIEDADKAGDAGDWDKYDELTNAAEALERESAAGKGQNIMPSYVGGKTKEIDLEGADFMDQQDYINSEILKAKKEGYDSLKLKRLVDDAGLTGSESDHIVTFNPKHVVSKFDGGLLDQPTQRLDMTPEQRRAKPPWQTLDVPENELIVRRGSGVNQSTGGGGYAVTKRDESGIFGEGAEAVRYTDPETGGTMEVLTRPNQARDASVLELLVPEEHRRKGVAKGLLNEVMAKHPSLMGQVSSRYAAKNAYAMGRRPMGEPNATLEETYKIMDDWTSVNMATPE